MSAFNPYSHWLGLTGKDKPDTYYELLGLKHGDKNVARIAEHAEAVLAKVQQMGPEGHFPEWNQILTEIQVAKNCLCNPKYKADYDAAHPATAASSFSDNSAASAGGAQMASPFGGMNSGATQSQPQSPAPNDPSLQNQNPQQMQGQPGMQPGMMGMQPGMMPMQPGMMGMQPGMMPMQPGMMGMQPGMMPMQPGMMGMQPGMMPMQPGMMGMQPGMMPMQPGMQNMYGGVMYPQQGVAAPVQGVAAPVQPVQPVSPQGVPVSAPVSSPLSGGDSIFGSSSSPSSASSVSSSGVKSGTKSGAKSGARGTKSRHAQNGPSAMVRNIIALVGLGIIVILAIAVVKKFSGNGEADNSPIQVAVDENGNTSLQFNNPFNPNEPPDVPAPGAAPAAPAAAETPQDAPSAEDLGALQIPDFDQILRFVSEYNFADAKKLLNKCGNMRVSSENQKRLERLQLIINYAEGFYASANEILDKLQPPCDLCEGKYGVVEAGNGRAKLHIEGKNVEFSLTEPERQGHNLYDILYNHKFAKASDSGNMLPSMQYASFELILPKGNKDKAVKLLNNVLEKGTEDNRKDVHAIYEEFGINGLGAMTNQALAETAAAEKNVSDADADADAKKAEEEKDADAKTGTEAEKTPADAKTAADDEDADSGKVSSKGGKKRKGASSGEDAEEGEDGDSDAKSGDAEKEKEKAARDLERHKEEWSQITTQVRQDLGWRRIPAVKRNLSQLQKLAESDEEKHELERLTALTSYTETFVTWIGNYMSGYTAGGSVNIDGQEIGIVESAPGRLMIREQGVNKLYTIEDLNPKLVAWLVREALKAPDDYVLYGTYLAMDPDGDRAKAKTMWGTAKTKGFDKDSIDLIMEELDVALVDSGRKPVQQNVRTGVKGKNQITEPQTIPTGDAHDAALAKIKEEFAKDYAKTDMRSQSKQAEKFVKQAQSANRAADEAYILAEEAYRLASENSYFETAYEALMVQQTRFQRDTYQDRLSMVSKGNPTARGASSTSEIVNCAIEMGIDAVQRKKKIDANQMLNIAKKNAKGSQVQRVRELERVISMMK